MKLLSNLNTINADDELLSSIKFGRRLELMQTSYSSKLKKMQNKITREQKNIPFKIKVLDVDQNLIAIGYLLWENKSCYFQPSKVFI